MSLSKQTTSRFPLQFIAILSLTLAILSFVSPQVSMLGRGLRTTLPAMAVSFFAISVISPKAFLRGFARLWSTFLLGFIFLTQAAFRFAHDDKASALWHTFFWGPLFAILLLLWIAAFTELGSDAVHRLRRWVSFSWCISLAVGLPSLITHPGVARLTMGNPSAVKYAAIWAPLGVGEYSVYTALAICLGPLFVTLHHLKGLWRWIALPLLCLAATAVLLSTFTMASACLVLSLSSILLVWAMGDRGWSRILRTFLLLFMVLLLVVMFPLLYDRAKKIPQAEFVVTKVERLFYGISKAGLERGDETERGKMFTDEMRSFVEEPFFGYIPGVTGQKGHGHSSLSNSLVLFGLFGALLWFAALFEVFRNSQRNTMDSLDRHALWISWGVLILGGILNPLWHSTAVLCSLFALTLPPRKDQYSHSEIIK
jgi:hypothetical protein